MAKTISELRNQSIQVRDASAVGENTATRVGTVLNDIVGHIEDYENTQSSNNSSQDAKIDSVKTSLNAEIARAKTEESNLSNLIGTERTERQAAVSSEETARIQADNAEKTARQQADNAEQDARIKADNAEKTARENADITLRTMIQTEVSDREKAVAAEAARAKAAEQANTQAIADETARATAAEQAETIRATTEEERLQGEIDNTNDNLNSKNDHLVDEVARLDTTDAEIKADLEAEKAAIIGNDRIGDNAVTTDKLSEELQSDLQDIQSEEQNVYEDKITISDDTNNIVADINSEFSDFKNLKSNGKDVLTEVNTQNIIDSAVTTDKLSEELQSDLQDIQSEEQNVYEDKITISDDNDNIVADINSEYSDFKNLKSNGKDVLTGKMLTEHSIGTVAHLGLINIATPSDFDYSLIVIYGQSLSQGGAAQGALSIEAIEGNYTLSTGINTSGRPNYSSATLSPLKVAEKSEEHPVCGFVNAYSVLYRKYRDKNAKFIGLAGGYSGAQIEYINKGTTYYNNFIAACTRIKEIADSENKTVGCVSILFMQGESNYIPNSGVAEQSKSGYKDLMRKLKEDLQNDLSGIFQQEHNPSFLMYQTGYKWIRNSHWDCSISQAQLEISQEIDDIILVNPTYQLTINSSQHPNYNGYRWFGEQAAKALWLAINNGLRYETVRPVSIYVADSNKIVVSVYAPVFPIKVDTWTNNQIKDYGFDVKLNGSICEITSVNVDGTKIIVETKQDLSNGIVEISYAGLNRQGQGNICDSDTWRSLTNYMNDLDDSEWNTTNYNYPVVKRPLDMNGNYIFGKPYPMQNWMSNFYYNLSFHFKSNLVKCSIGDTVKNDLVNTGDLQGISFSSSDESVVNVSDNGELTLNTEGSCFITAEATRDNVTYKADYLLIVKS